jgi:hypothetical protein
MKLAIAGAIAAISLTGCAISQKIMPVTSASGSDVCVVDNRKVRETFRAEVVRGLRAKSIPVREVQETSDLSTCGHVLRYNANWRWDLAMYMARAEITVFKGSQVVGSAYYDATSGGGRPDKFISAETKIAELVDKLFPGGPAPR